ncbi:toll/interleukin-1 receptor domain-containing protein [Sphingomonas gei]|uniref:Toll/interleukin-1 receptor domain-containing protein n=1 Tax=Sphingomonas gei TaxID=1395960 RepID=A0A4V3QZL9_9SPHN|nr:toll/interleukin-1 receptor domain-containing protein [Sphingomonas gei]TGX54782.1 toll/interleukin-1 receptor domain-containing protein [Sphingomonas gei]
MTKPAIAARDTILITHANPEDNRFARWLAARLTTAGYKTWVDVRSLRGGDDFWDRIEHVLRHETVKQVVVVSEHIGKQGVKKELALGDVMRRKLGDQTFMIPIRIGDVDYGELPTEILRQNSHNAFPNWAACLEPLLETLDTAAVPKVSGPDAALLSTIVAAQEDGRKLVADIPETLYSNWFELEARPDVWVMEAKGTTAQLEAWGEFTRVPHVLHSGGAIAFCGPVAIEGLDGAPPPLKARASLPFNSVVDGAYTHVFGERSNTRRIMVNLMRQHWDLAMHSRGLLPVNFASGARGWFFPDGLISKSVKIALPDGHKVDRVLSGKFKERRWHLCLVAQPKLWPDALYRVHANVAVTIDGKTPLPGEQLQRIRLRLTRSWFNDKWRDMLLAAMGWLSEGADTLDLAAMGERLSVASLPMTFDFPVSFVAEEDRQTEEDETGQITLSEEFDSAFDSDPDAEEAAA